MNGRHRSLCYCFRFSRDISFHDYKLTLNVVGVFRCTYVCMYLCKIIYKNDDSDSFNTVTETRKCGHFYFSF